MRIYAGALAFEETMKSLFETDSLDSGRFFEVYGGTDSSPEKLLMLAVLEDALICIQNHASASKGWGPVAFRNALDWIATDDPQWPFSFNNICETLGFDSSSLRAALFKLAERNAPRAADRKLSWRDYRTKPGKLPQRARLWRKRRA